MTKLIGITREGGEEGEGIVDPQDFESAGGQFAGEAIEKESDFAVGADGADAGGGEGESFGLGIEGFEGAGDEVGGGGDKKIGFDAFADPLIDCGTKTVNHDGDTDGHGNGDGESGGGQAVAMEASGKGGAGKNRGGEGKGGEEGKEATEGGGEEGGGEENKESGEKSGTRNACIKCGGGKKKCQQEAGEGGEGCDGEWGGGTVGRVPWLKCIDRGDERGLAGGPPCGQGGGEKACETGSKEAPGVDHDLLHREEDVVRGNGGGDRLKEGAGDLEAEKDS